MACWPVLCLLPHAIAVSILLQKKIVFFLLTVWFLFLGKHKHSELSPCVLLFVSLLGSLGERLPGGAGRVMTLVLLGTAHSQLPKKTCYPDI